VRAGDDLRGFRQREVRLFVQDSWKAAPHLTVNYGLAWAFYGVPFEVNNNLSTLFADPTAWPIHVFYRGPSKRRSALPQLQ